MLKVEDGCVNFCSYCIIPYARGPVRSLPLDRAAAEVRRLREEGYREIVLTGIEISSWGQDLKEGKTLIDLVEAICREGGDLRVRLGSLEPRTVTEEFCRRAAALPNLCPHFHLSLQSGCDETLRRMHFLRSFDLKAILIACGTVSTTSLSTLQKENDLPVVGVVEPTCRRAVMQTRNKKVGMIATQASVRSGAYEEWIGRLDPSVTVYAKPCPLFVPLVESGRIHPGDVVIETVAREYLTELRETGMDTLILGCTHYPLLAEVIRGVMGPDVELVSAGEESAYELKRLLKENGLRAEEGRQGDAEYYVSDREEDFERIASLFLQEDLHHAARRVDIDQY